MKTADLILLQLKSHGPHSAKMLAEKLSMTTMGVRQHMQLLEQKEMICYEDVRTKVGRPTRYWALTNEGHAQFPNKHHTLATTLLESTLEIFGKEGLEKLLCSREDKIFQRYSQALSSCLTLESKLDKIAELRQEDGYMATVTRNPGGFLLVENHCPISSAASTCNKLCSSEVKLLARLLGNECYIKRIEHIMSGSRRCAYLITPRE